jgi:hypothetical protein
MMLERFIIGILERAHAVMPNLMYRIVPAACCPFAQQGTESMFR